MGIEQDINRKKKALINKASKKGLYENFGQKEVRQLKDKYPVGFTGKGKENMDAIDEFERWASTFDDRKLSQLKKVS
jgi:hypothetical protein